MLTTGRSGYSICAVSAAGKDQLTRQGHQFHSSSFCVYFEKNDSSNGGYYQHQNKLLLALKPQRLISLINRCGAIVIFSDDSLG